MFGKTYESQLFLLSPCEEEEEPKDASLWKEWPPSDLVEFLIVSLYTFRQDFDVEKLDGMNRRSNAQERRWGPSCTVSTCFRSFHSQSFVLLFQEQLESGAFFGGALLDLLPMILSYDKVSEGTRFSTPFSLLPISGHYQEYGKIYCTSFKTSIQQFIPTGFSCERSLRRTMLTDENERVMYWKCSPLRNHLQFLPPVLHTVICLWGDGQRGLWPITNILIQPCTSYWMTFFFLYTTNWRSMNKVKTSEPCYRGFLCLR